MSKEGRAARAGLGALVCALLFRLGALGIPQRLLAETLKPNIARALIYLETGRHVRFSASSGDLSPEFMESSPASAVPDALPVFSEETGTQMKNFTGKRPDPEALLAQPLTWQLRTDEPTVLILHTHATESYERSGEAYTELSPWRTLDEGYNMLAVGQVLAERLEQGGIHVLQDRTLHDYPSYNDSYVHARKSLEEYIRRYPSLCLVLDVHRDASDGSAGQLRTLAQAEGAPCAQLMLVVGSNHPAYEQNLSLALKLQAELERLYPGITRPLQLRQQRFNQDLSAGALLVEVGGAGNSQEEALRAARALADAIAALAGGTG